MTKIDEKISELIQSAKSLPKELDFKAAIKQLTNTEVFVFNEVNNTSDKKIKDRLVHICTNFIQELETNQELVVDADTNLRTYISNWIVNRFRILLQSDVTLQDVIYNRPEYPRFSFNDDEGNRYYLTIRTSQKDEPESTLRAFYFSSGLKVDKSGKHLMISFIYTITPETEDLPYRIVFPTDFSINDLSNLKIKFKLEFAANYKQLSNTRIIIKESF